MHPLLLFAGFPLLRWALELLKCCHDRTPRTSLGWLTTYRCQVNTPFVWTTNDPEGGESGLLVVKQANEFSSFPFLPRSFVLPPSTLGSGSVWFLYTILLVLMEV